MLFITNRFPTQSIRSKVGRKFTFDMKNNAASNSVFFCESTGKDDITEVGSAAFLSRLRESKYYQILLFCHGFSVSPEESLAVAERLQSEFDGRDAHNVLVVPIIWPTDNNQGIVEAYWDDQRSADLSGYSFARAFQKFIEWRNDADGNPTEDPCLKRINILAHSMGVRVLRESLLLWTKYDLPGGVPLIFRNAFLAAGDVVNETLQPENSGISICNASRNVVVYYASDDLALRASKAANLKNRIASRRLGHTGPENPDKTPKNVYAIDCDDINAKYDMPLGHSYFLDKSKPGSAGKVFEHIYDCMKTGRVFPDDVTRRLAILDK